MAAFHVVILNNGNTATLIRQVVSGSTRPTRVTWEVLERDDTGKLVQRRTYAEDERDKAEAWMNEFGVGVCQSCRSRPGLPDHSCPFAEDVLNNHTTTCNCCNACTQECANDI